MAKHRKGAANKGNNSGVQTPEPSRISQNGSERKDQRKSKGSPQKARTNLTTESKQHGSEYQRNNVRSAGRKKSCSKCWLIVGLFIVAVAVCYVVFQNEIQEVAENTFHLYIEPNLPALGLDFKYGRELRKDNAADEDTQESLHTFDDLIGRPAGAHEEIVKKEDVESRREPVKESKEPVKESREPVKESREPAKDTRQPVKETREPVKESREPIKESRELVKESRVPVKESKEPVKETREPAKESKEPVKESKEPSKETREPVKESKEPVKESKESVKESKEPVKESKEPVKESKEPVKESKEPVKESKEPVKESKEPVKESKEPVKESKEPVKESKEPVKESKEPVKESKEPSKETREPVKESKEPVKESKEPVKESKEPVKESKEPVKESKEPVKESKEPVKESKEPVKESKEPVKESKEPVKESKEPVKESKEPVNESKEPVKENKEPVKESKEPVKESKEPVKESKEPVKESKEPVKESKEPVKESKEPVKESKEPVKESKEPVKESKEPVKESKEPVKESKEPVKESKEPVKESKEPSKESKEPVKKSKESVKESKEPVKESKEPVKESKEPVKESKEPVKESKEPVKESKEPVKESKEPVKDTREPAKETRESVKETREPVKETKEPVKESKEPVKESKEPSKESKEPMKKSKESVKESKEPVKKSKESVKESKEPVKESKEPVKESKEPVKESKEPVKESKEPVKESKEPVKESKEPVKESKEPVKERKDQAKETRELVKESTEPVIESIKVKVTSPSEKTSVESRIESGDDIAITKHSSQRPSVAEQLEKETDKAHADELRAKEPKETEPQAKEADRTTYAKASITNEEDYKVYAELDEADEFLEKGNLEKAIQKYDQILQKHILSPRAHFGKGLTLDQLGFKYMSNENLEHAIEFLARVLDLPSVPDELQKLAGRKLADRQQFRGWGSKAVKTFKILIQRFPDDVALKNELGVSYLMIGQSDRARDVFKEVLVVDPSNGFAKAHLGFILKTEYNDLEGAIQLLSEGIASGAPGTADGRFYLQLGDSLLRLGREREARKVFQEGEEKGVFLSAWQRSLYNVDRLTGRPWWTAEQTPYQEFLQLLKDNWKVIRDEGLAQLNAKTGSFIPEEENLRDTGDWKQFTLYQQGRKKTENCAKAPETCKLIDKIPDAKGCKRGQVKFSVMSPGIHVWPHNGPTNCRIRAHLGLVVPEGPIIRVMNETRTWKEGDFIIFDDSFEHEVWHEGSELRLVLIVDFWHPELTEAEKKRLSAI